MAAGGLGGIFWIPKPVSAHIGSNVWQLTGRDVET